MKYYEIRDEKEEGIYIYILVLQNYLMHKNG